MDKIDLVTTLMLLLLTGSKFSVLILADLHVEFKVEKIWSQIQMKKVANLSYSQNKTVKKGGKRDSLC